MTASRTFYAKMTDTGNTEDTIERLYRLNFVNVIAPLISSEYIRELSNETLAAKQIMFTRSPLILTADYWNHHYSPYISPPNLDVSDEEVLNNNMNKFKQDIRFAFHIKSVGYIVVKLLNRNPWKLGRLLIELIDNYKSYATILVEIPMVDPIAFSSKYCENSDHRATSKDQWEKWHQFHAATDFSGRFELSLVMGPKLPSRNEFKRWLGDGPIRMVVIPSSCFVINKSGLPILPPKHKQFVVQLFQYHKCIFTIDIPEVEENRLNNFRDYLNDICQANAVVNDQSGSEDLLRFPLQPLYDDLDSMAYETFEADSRKYKLYQDAIEAALIDKVPQEQISSKILTVLIVGAGRGPLIRASVNASKLSGRQIKIIVVEKNPYAIITLAQLIESLWPELGIELISKDMRCLKLKEKADIIVSELLGSFGDNELSPECLDGAQDHLKLDGISIPYKSISYVRPIMSTKVFQLVREKTYLSFPEIHPLHSYWLNNFSKVFYIDHPKDCFTFVHPNKYEPIDNTRHAMIEFEADIDCVLDGFAGYFTAKLFRDIEISIHPYTFTNGMCSWYPIFFSAPVRIETKKGETIVLEIWRKVDGEKVWFEWRTFLKDEWGAHDDVVSNKNGASAYIQLYQN